ncbi:MULTISPECIES: NADP-dependent oxidoreductase [Klebsiella]|uniref:NADP-dependent oxidoreductase n=1 Tax=Klebsiella TaxID=570 RepID=UPI000B413CBC|nr:NADP-dependent oxidoreductase [Klebsiella pasteurii]MDX7158053.1 NADP-dependent oxidoreductase [Klebsiella pasteurii]OVU30672.1 NADPH:quinone reductase [Klebsiella michiganensis]VUT14789.1 2-haloacrylate reductase [Klebsiella pasteurii]
MSIKVMKAVQQYAFGGPEVLRYEEVPVPDLQPNEVLVRVYAVGLNPPDWYLRDGYRMLPPEWQPKVTFPVILGTDISGVIVAVGENVTAFSVGDEVYSMVHFPDGAAGSSRAYAEYVSVAATEVARKPRRLDHIHAAAAPMSLLTAWQFMIEQGHDVQNPLQPTPHKPVPLAGQTVLVNGAAGGVGHFAVQLAKWQGAYVIAVASGEHEVFLLNLGVDEFIDYTKQAAEDVVRNADLVIDAVGGPSAGRFLRTLRRGGALFPIYPLGFSGTEEAQQLGVTVSATQVRSNGAQLAQLAELLDKGVIQVAVDSTFPLAHALQAHERAARGHIQGKIVLSVINPE